jgi:hypothetical protein
MQQGCPQPHEEVPSALETLLLESASYVYSFLVVLKFVACTRKAVCRDLFWHYSYSVTSPVARSREVQCISLLEPVFIR